MTDVERTLWQAIRARELLDCKFRRQATIGPSIVDFLCVEARLVVELDAGQHGVENFERIIAEIAAALEESRKTLTQPSPAKAGEG